MADILPDSELEKLLNKCIINPDKDSVKANSYELRLGSQVRFHSTNEVKELKEGQYLELSPSESATIASFETIDFKEETVITLYPDNMLLGLVLPTTTMMREGIAQTSTQVDPGYQGTLNWLIRNNSTKPIVIKYGERVFKLVIFRLGKTETPKVPYGDRSTDSYQGSEGIVRSARKVPADLDDGSVVRATRVKIDPRIQLREAGPPFSHVDTVLREFDGKLQVVSQSVEYITERIKEQNEQLRGKIDTETKTLNDKLESVKDTLLSQMKAFFNEKTTALYGYLLALAAVGTGVFKLIAESKLSTQYQSGIFLLIGLVAIFMTGILVRRTGRDK
jgi:deoxycytidine triphosphate deaminase